LLDPRDDAAAAIFREKLHHLIEVQPAAGFRRFNIDKFLYNRKIIADRVIAEKFQLCGN